MTYPIAHIEEATGCLTMSKMTEIDISYVHDLRRSPLPPFAPVTYWWQIEDAAAGT